uniref:Uncharacterized protein B11E6.020 n=1 Tax=Neurospora crassa TaxID=5141 RepID=Q96U99_NEUCS|nr:hypothetical protein [Neurospora crassa]
MGWMFASRSPSIIHQDEISQPQPPRMNTHINTDRLETQPLFWPFSQSHERQSGCGKVGGADRLALLTLVIG